MKNNGETVTATDTVVSLDIHTLVTVAGGVRPGPNGEGCTGPGCGTGFPRPRPRPTFPLPGGPIVDPAPRLD